MLFVSWQRDDKSRAALGAIFGDDRSAEQFHEVLGDRQSQAGAAGIPCARLVDAVEALEDAQQVFLGNAGPLVRYGNRRAANGTSDVDADRRAFRRVGGRVGDQIAKRVV